MYHASTFYLEDRSGCITCSDFDDIYDRLFLRVTLASSMPQLPTHIDPLTPSPTSPVSPTSLPFSNSSLEHIPAEPFALIIHNTGRRSSARGPPRELSRRVPNVVLEFGPHGALGTVSFPASSKEAVRIPMGQWLRKTSVFGGALSRRFKASDGREYRWVHASEEGTEWTLLPCVPSTQASSPIAQYNLRHPSKPAYNTSGNILSIMDPHARLAPEILASLCIMRVLYRATQT